MSDHADPPDIGVRPPNFSDDALALAFSDRHAGQLVYVAGWGCWMRWTGHKWAPDDTLAIFDLGSGPFTRLGQA